MLKPYGLLFVFFSAFFALFPVLFPAAFPAARAEEVALADAWAKLGEFTAGLAVQSIPDVRDLTDLDQRLRGTLQARLSRLSEQELFHYENGVAQCRVTVNMTRGRPSRRRGTGGSGRRRGGRRNRAARRVRAKCILKKM